MARPALGRRRDAKARLLFSADLRPSGGGEGLRDAEGDVGTSALIGRMGGRIDIAEVHLEVPSDAVDSDILIMVRRLSVAPGAIGPAFAFQPGDLTFARSLGIAIDLPQPP